jgi:hypothetical protein
VVPRQQARLGSESDVAVRKEELGLADSARVQQELARALVRRRVLEADADVELAEGDPHRLAAPADVDHPALDRQQAPEGGDGLRRRLVLEPRDEAELPDLIRSTGRP